MNKRGQGGQSVTKLTGITIVIVALLLLVVFVNQSSGDVRDVSDDLLDVRGIIEEELTDERSREVTEANSLATMLKEQVEKADENCISSIDLSGVNDDFVIDFFDRREGNFVSITKWDSTYDVRKILGNDVYFNFDGTTDFTIKDLKEIEVEGDMFDLGQGIFIFKSSDDNVYFLDFFGAAILRGFFSDVLRKPVCGETENIDVLDITNINFDVVSGTTLEEAEDMRRYLNSNLVYLDTSYKVYELLRYSFDLEVQRDRGDFPIETELNNVLNLLGNHLEEYLGEDYRGLPISSENACWRVTGIMEDIGSTVSYGKSKSMGGNLRYRKLMMELSDESNIEFYLSVSKEGCLPYIEIDKLLRSPENTETFNQ